MGTLKYHPTSLISYERLAPGMPGRSYQTKLGLPPGCQVKMKCFYAKSTCLGSNYRNISSLTLVQKVIRDICRGMWIIIAELTWLWLISHDLSHGVPLMILQICEKMNFNS
jgi:hypothetical protein